MTEAALSVLRVRSDLEPVLLTLWRRLLGRPHLTVDDDFIESGGDSILATEMIIEVERLTGVTIPPAIFVETGTIRQLVRRLREGGALTPKVAVRMGGDAGRLVHFFHGDFNYGGISVRTVTGSLLPNQQILAIAPHGSDGGEIPATIEEMAAERLQIVRAAQQHGPYVLGGHCNGALVAFEVSRLLIAAGEKVDLVLMIDPVIVSVRPSMQALLAVVDGIQRARGIDLPGRRETRRHVWQRFAKFGRDTRRWRSIAERFWNKAPADKWAALRRRMAGGLTIPPQPDPGVSAGRARFLRKEVWRPYDRALAAYSPAPLDVPVLYFSLAYSGRPWRRIVPGAKIIDLPGSHSRLAGEFATTAGPILMEVFRGPMVLHHPSGSSASPPK